jgi:hypothetical protein
VKATDYESIIPHWVLGRPHVEGLDYNQSVQRYSSGGSRARIQRMLKKQKRVRQLDEQPTSSAVQTCKEFPIDRGRGIAIRAMIAAEDHKVTQWTLAYETISGDGG